MNDWMVVPLDRVMHQRAEFSCGKALLDDFLHHRVTQYEKRRLGKTYFAVTADDPRVLGYYTLASGTISFAHLPASVAKKLPKHPIAGDPPGTTCR